MRGKENVMVQALERENNCQHSNKRYIHQPWEGVMLRVWTCQQCDWRR